MDIAFSFDKNFLDITCVAIESVIATNTDLTIHILSHNLSETDKQKISGNKNATFKFYDVDAAKFQELPEISNDGKVEITRGMYYRLMLTLLLPKDIKRVLYLDGDVIVTAPLLDFYNTNLIDKAVAAIHDDAVENEATFSRLDLPADNGYFNSGVLLINLEYWREHDVGKQAIDFIANNTAKCKYLDQDALNIVCAGKVAWASKRYNTMTYVYNKMLRDKEPLSPEQLEAATDPAIIHYSSRKKPWCVECAHPLRNVWRRLYKLRFGKPCRLRYCYSGIVRAKWQIKHVLHKLGIKQYSDYTIFHEFDSTERSIMQRIFKD